ncbi:Retrovirus-related Pol polyprotein from transposon [Trichinella nelsoni]|uniref:Retrovirus-related Pol polyprotein from transposon n=1 Tax=Trichinella nelsoni TaxID=6336 RepID=A0A0V0S013_9BILA|nr:Retrovirus-related Pol polyprotein from transposon [Trichinella nelsoni]
MLDVAGVAANVIYTSSKCNRLKSRKSMERFVWVCEKIIEAHGANINIAARKKQLQCHELCKTPCSTEHLPNLCHDNCDKLSTFTYGGRGSWQAHSGFRLLTWQAATDRWRGRSRTGKGPPLTTPYGVYQFKVLPFGLCNAPAICHRLMETALRGLDCQRAYGPTARGAPPSTGSEPESEAREMPAHKEEGGILRSYHIRERHRHGPMQNMRSHTELRDGVAAVPGTGVGGAEWDWSEACQSAFDAFKYRLTSAIILAYPDIQRQYTVDVDARGDGLGAMLSQREGKTERVVAYESRTLTKAERRYCATQKEMLSLVWALREFRPYLYGQRFLVRTDHSYMRWLRNFKEPEGQVACWLESLAEVDFEVEHRAGRLQGNADALPRASVRAAKPGSEDVTQSIRDQLVVAQQAYSDIRLLRQWLVGANWPVECPPECSCDVHLLWQKRRSWADEDGLIWRHRRGLKTGKGLSSRYAGHLGERRTLERCARRKGPAKNNRAPIQAMTAGYPLQRVGVDILGPLERTPSGNQYVLVLTDYFTKCTVAFPLTNRETGTVAKVLVEKYIVYFGAPDYLHSDQGLSFEASVHQKDTILSIQPTREWTSGEVQPSAPLYAVPHGRWEPAPVGRHAAVCHAGVQQQRSREHGGDACDRHVWLRAALPLYVQMGNPPEQETQGLPEYIRDHLKTQQRRQKCLYDCHANETRFCLNDSVLLAVPRRQKLHRNWEGAYLIVEVMGPETYRVRHQEQKRRSLVVHLARMKRYHARESAGDRVGTTIQQEHQPPAAAFPPASEMRKSSGRTSLKEGECDGDREIVPGYHVHLFVEQPAVTRGRLAEPFVYNKLSVLRMVRINRAPDGATPSMASCVQHKDNYQCEPNVCEKTAN